MWDDYCDGYDAGRLFEHVVDDLTGAAIPSCAERRAEQLRKALASCENGGARMIRDDAAWQERAHDALEESARRGREAFGENGWRGLLGKMARPGASFPCDREDMPSAFTGCGERVRKLLALCVGMGDDGRFTDDVLYVGVRDIDRVAMPMGMRKGFLCEAYRLGPKPLDAILDGTGIVPAFFIRKKKQRRPVYSAYMLRPTFALLPDDDCISRKDLEKTVPSYVLDMLEEDGLLVPHGSPARYDMGETDLDACVERITGDPRYDLASLSDMKDAVKLVCGRHGICADVGAPLMRRACDDLGLVPKAVSGGDAYYATGESAGALSAERVIDEVYTSYCYEYGIEREDVSVRREREEKRRRSQERIRGGVHVGVRTRPAELPHAEMWLGPTNSGKTYHAMERLCADYEHDRDAGDATGRYVYAGPLRMLAYEQYNRLRGRYGDAVGFVTGEEQINEDAPILCCTVEMAPRSGRSLVLDETHWMIDPDRGQYWTNLLVGGSYDRMYVIAAAEAAPQMRRMLADAGSVTEERADRLVPIAYAGSIEPADVRPRTAVVSFSRKAVYALARIISKASGLRVGVVYGAMPIEVRERQIEAYLAGEYDVISCTDVIGHGINLPIDNVVFAETEKFDGHQRRDLMVWEAAQIAGRAGRYGLCDRGRVYVLSSPSWVTPSPALVREATDAAAGRAGTDIDLNTSLITPAFEDLGVDAADEVAYAMECWASAVGQNDRARALSLSAAGMDTRKRIIESVAAYTGARMAPWDRGDDWGISGRMLWDLSGLPLVPDSDALYQIARWACVEDRESSPILRRYAEKIANRIDRYDGRGGIGSDASGPASVPGNAEQLYDMEQAYSDINQISSLQTAFGTMGTLGREELDGLRERVVDVCWQGTRNSQSDAPYGRCSICGAETAPWLDYCDDCYEQIRFGRRWYDEDEEIW